MTTEPPPRVRYVPPAPRPVPAPPPAADSGEEPASIQVPSYPSYVPPPLPSAPPTLGGAPYHVYPALAVAAPPRRHLLVVIGLAVGALVVAGSSVAVLRVMRSGSAAPTSAQLTKLLLQPGDLPGWKAEPASADGPEDGVSFAAGGADCQRLVVSSAQSVADAASSQFTLNKATFSSSASSYRSADQVKAEVASLSDPAGPACFKAGAADVLAKSLPTAVIDSMDVTVVPGSGGGPANVAATLTMKMTVTYSGQQISEDYREVMITGTRIEAEVHALNVDAAVPADVFNSAVSAVAARVSASGK